MTHDIKHYDNDRDTQPILFINIDTLDLYYQLYKDDIEKDHQKHMSFLEENKTYYDDYINLYNEVKEYDRKNQNDKRKYYIKPSGEHHYLEGGSLLSAGIVLGTFALSGLIACMLYFIINPSDTCNDEYPLFSLRHEKTPSVGNIIETILPSEWIKKGLDSGETLNSTINEISQYLDTLTSVFSIVDESAGTKTERVLKSVTKVSLSVGAAVITAGMGGDKIVNIPFFISKAVNMIAKTFNKLLRVSQTITDIMKTAGKLTDVTNIKKITNMQKSQLSFIYDLFSINFSGGPYQTTCWTNYVMEYYTNNETDTNSNKMICLINDIFNDINDTVISFVGSALDMIVPESMGLIGTLAPLLKEYDYVIYGEIRDQITENYKMIPGDIRMFIQHPKKLSSYIFEMFNSYTLGMSDRIIPDNAQQHLKKGIDIFAMSIHKGLSMIFIFLNIFTKFADINANIDTNMLLKKCTECGNITDPNIGICKSCKIFYLSGDENVNNMTSDDIIAKCTNYANMRNKMKLDYQRLKSISKKSISKKLISKNSRKT